MNISDFEKASDFAKEEDRTRDLLVARESGEEESGFDIGEVPLGEEIADKLQELVKNSIKDHIDDCKSGKKDFEEHDINNVDKDKTPVQYINLENNDFPFVETIQNLANNHNFPDTSYKDPRPDFQAIRIKNSDGKKLVALRNYTNHQLVGQKDRYLMWFKDNRYDKFEDEVIKLPNKIDAIYYDNTIYIFKQRSFEDIFDYEEHLIQEVESVYEEIEESDVLIHNMDEFQQRANNDREKLRKLHEVSRNGITDELTMERAQMIIDEYDLNLELEENEDGEKGIRIPNGRLVWTAIRLFNNDHLESPVNQDQFQVYSKDKRSD